VSEAARSKAWISQRAPLWRELDGSLKNLRSGQSTTEQATQVLDGYRALARDLALSRQILPGSNITAALETLYASFHAMVNRKPGGSWATLRRVLREDIPQVMRSLRTAILWVTLIFVLSVGVGWWLIDTYPTLIGLMASQEMINRVEAGELWTDGLLNIAPSSILSVQIFSNNIAVSIFAICAGVFYGLGTFYLISINGLMLGGMFAFTRLHGLDDRLLKFVVAHGMVELSIICLCGAAGMALGESLIRPSLPSRRDSFQACVARLSKLMLLFVPLLVGCGIIEGYISPDPSYSWTTRIVVGVGYWLIMIGAITGRLFGAVKPVAAS
jgi:uncharacterized membrane protein SpoIIM required for sporulation